jgi:hypothetical protein
MISVSIRTEDWSVAATVRDGDVHNPFAGVNEDAILAQAIDDALGHAGPSVWKPLYVLAKVVEDLDPSEIPSLQAAANAFKAAAAEYRRIAEQKSSNTRPTQPTHQPDPTTEEPTHG